MAVKHIGGFGGFKVESGDYSVEFTAEEAIGEVFVEEEVIDFKDLNHDIQEWYMGGRGTVRSRLFNITDTSCIKFKTLAQLIDIAKADRTTLRIYPHYNSAAVGSEYYDCNPPRRWHFSPIFEDCEKGQEFPEFEAITKGVLGQLPQHVDVLVPDSRVTADGDTRVTPDGDTRVVNTN